MPIWLQIQNYINYVLIITAVIIRDSAENGNTIKMGLMGAGILFLIAKALNYHFPYNLITSSLSRRNKSKLHGSLQIVGGLMVLFGGLGTMEHDEYVIPAYICFASIIGGILNYAQPKFLYEIRHNILGLFSLGITAFALAYFTMFFTKYVNVLFLAFKLVFLITIIYSVLSH